ncbi:MAG: lytic transglycosylase domain-containing protein, partial [Croceibacterium sp.]
MSSMVRTSFIAALLASVLSTSVPAGAQDVTGNAQEQDGLPQDSMLQQGHDWDAARASLVARTAGPMAGAIARWEQLTASRSFPFDSYASFLLSYPGFPDEDRLRASAELRLGMEFVPPERVLAYFDRFPPLTNNGRAQYAVALMQLRPNAAEQPARAAWAGGEMSDGAESLIRSSYGAVLTQAEQDARMDALLWQRSRPAAERQLALASPARQSVFAARLSILQGGDGATGDPAAAGDPGYLYNRSRGLRSFGRGAEAASLLANSPALSRRPFDETLWVEELLVAARAGSARDAQRIASRVDEAFAPGADISAKG